MATSCHTAQQCCGVTNHSLGHDSSPQPFLLTSLLKVVNLSGNGFTAAAQQQQAAVVVPTNGAASTTASTPSFLSTFEDGVEGVQMSDRRIGQTGMFVRVSSTSSSSGSSTITYITTRQTFANPLSFCEDSPMKEQRNRSDNFSKDKVLTSYSAALVLSQPQRPTAKAARLGGSTQQWYTSSGSGNLHALLHSPHFSLLYWHRLTVWLMCKDLQSAQVTPHKGPQSCTV